MIKIFNLPINVSKKKEKKKTLTIFISSFKEIKKSIKAHP